MRPSEQMRERTQTLLTKSQEGGLDAEELVEWNEIMRIEHLVRMAKAKAALKLRAA